MGGAGAPYEGGWAIFVRKKYEIRMEFASLLRDILASLLRHYALPVRPAVAYGDALASRRVGAREAVPAPGLQAVILRARDPSAPDSEKEPQPTNKL